MDNGIKIDTLKSVLNKLLNKNIINADYTTKELHGGTVGNVQLITGIAKTVDEKIPFNVVLKVSKKWERYNDINSWRREYDLYSSNLDTVFSGSLRWPKCYHLEQNDNEIQLWLEYIDGITGLDLTPDMYESAAYELGRFQGKLYIDKPSFLNEISNLSCTDYAKRFYQHYKSWNVVYDYIRSNDCEIPKHLCQMLIEFDSNSDEVFKRIEKLPVVFCHRDFWVTNIFNKNGEIILIDWDTTGWGYLGEDIASLIADEADVENMVENYQRCITAYYKGFSEYLDESDIKDNCILEFILALFGYRFIEWYINAETLEEKTLYINTLQKIYEIKSDFYEI
ncbi:MAG: aminoglycoside phosphotransferase family protein [Oscillospiraceae bacterium]|nr:aminoglycoside phosphotransferase family protein [Oscillospiraceae bacterium]